MNFIFLLLLLLISNSVFCQTIKHYKYWNKAYCSNHIYLNDSAGIFYYQEGCEGNVSIAKGKFVRRKKKIHFYLDTGTNVQLNAIVISNSGTISDSVYIQVVDFNEIPVRDFRIALFPISRGSQLMTEMITTNDSGYVIIDRKKYSRFIYQNVIELNANSNKEIPWIELESDKSNYTLMFNYPFFCLAYPHITINSSSPVSIKFKKNKLIDRKNKMTYRID